jgi:hypothetical protein
MPVIVEDGTIVANANSYASEAELATYASDRGITIAGTDTQLLIRAMDYIEQQNFQGFKSTKDQALQWPRYGVWIDGYDIASDVIPVLLKEAQMEAAIAVDGGNDPMANVGRETKKEKLGDLEVEYMDGARNDEYNMALETKLTKLLKRNGGSISAVAIRG